MANSKGGVLSPFTEQVEGLLSRSKSSYPEEEIDNWLQYPLDYTLERGCFSDLFGRLTSFLGNAKPDGDQGPPITTEDAGRRGTSTVSQNAKDSLALGAGRTSGLVLLEAPETCNKVKTIMQRAPCLQSDTSAQKASPLGIQHENCEPFHASLHSRGLSNKIILADKHPAYGALHNRPPHCLWSSSVYPIPPTHDMERLNLSEEAAAGSTLCYATHLINSDRISKASAAQAQIIHSPGNHCSLITENHMRDASLHTASAGHWESRGIAPYDASNSVSPAALCREGILQDTCDKVPDACVPTCSGGSRTSADMSAKETSSLGKQKREDYDNLSKNVEVDSADISEQQRRPSKRTRVAESHNLSEKRRRNRINEKLKTLQELIPNSSKTDKASILDEAIEYLKALQSQLQMMSSRSGMKLSSMGFSPGMQHIQKAHSMSLGFPLVHAGMGINMGIGLMDLPQGMDGRPFQALSVPSAHSNSPYPVRASLPSQACSQQYPSMEIASSELWPLQQPPAQAYPQMYIEPQTVSSIEQGEQLSALKVSEDR